MDGFLTGGLIVLLSGAIYSLFYVLGMFIAFTQKHRFFKGV